MTQVTQVPEARNREGRWSNLPIVVASVAATTSALSDYYRMLRINALTPITEDGLTLGDSGS